ncbi:MAG: alkaline phosphatase family protein, partial [Clostridiales bacterium]|nr:alkaline phosphatase family protein [Clostridiales bacterium]
EKKLDVDFVYAKTDDGTYDNVMNDIQSKDCSDFIFSIFEYCDHVGHSSDFLPTNPAYAEAFRNDDRVAHEVIEAIKARDTYEQEDWLIIMTTDHGGHNANHGGPTKQERYTFIVTNKEISR